MNMMKIPYKAIEDAFFSMEKTYDLHLTEGMDSYLVKVFDRIFQDERTEEFDEKKMLADFREEIFTDALQETFTAYREGALELECREKGIDFQAEMKKEFLKAWKNIREENVEIEKIIEPGVRLGLTAYQADAPREKLIRQGKWRIQQWAVRNFDSDTEGIFYFGQRMCERGLIHVGEMKEYLSYYVMEITVAGKDTVYEPVLHRLYVRAEVYDGLFREIMEAYGKVGSTDGKYLLEIPAKTAFGQMKEAFVNKCDDCDRKEQNREFTYLSVQGARNQIVKQLLEEIISLLNQMIYGYGKDTEGDFVVYGPYCLSEEQMPEHFRKENSGDKAGFSGKVQGI